MSAAADFDLTRRNQYEASDPDSSAWVIANAGSGKTHVLTQRVIRLLLAGADPASILCLTFTKIAAAEMARRVFETLGDWAMLPEQKLAEAISEMQDRSPTAEEVRQARRLFAQALETPGGLKIQTIHAFCERLLHQFPFEANVPGQFTVLDDAAAAALIETARGDVTDRAAAKPQSRLGQAMRYLAERANDQQIGEALDAVIRRRDELRRWMDNVESEGKSGDVDGALADLRERLELAPQETEEAICREVCEAAGWDRGDCAALADALAASLASAPHNWDARAHPELQAVLAAEMTIVEADARLNFFLTDGKDRPHGQRFGKAFAKSQLGLAESFVKEADRLVTLATRLNLVRAYSATEALLVVGDAILQAYHAAKRRSGMLDFADLIAKTRNLLSRADASAWVLYKLDRRVDHILVDEAQDTSQDQWAVVKALAEDFFSGEGAAVARRTVFAVGDDKQSIFGFQGAAPQMLAEMREYFARKVAEAGQPFVERPLFLSFRSTREVLKAVDEVFTPDLAEKITAVGYEAHSSHRDDQPGQVVVMPRIVRQKPEEPEEWTEPYDAPSAAETELARNIAGEIKRIRNTILPSGKRLEDGEILVLVRRRDAFAAAMNRALRAQDIPTAGADRIPVATHIAVLDLLALADVMLLPEDDLQLAALLKSPLVGLTEDELMHLAIGRNGSLWSTLRNAGEMRFREAAERLGRWRGMADQVTPFRFFATVLGPDGGRRAFRARLGGEADEVLDALLSQALAYEGMEAPSLQGFLRFIRANESDIKREAEEASSGVRVMTVHGAKGLEADVVFLADTGGLVVVPGQREVLTQIGEGRDGLAFLWRRRMDESPEIQRQAFALEDDKTRREYLRLLYVAMTRARDVLYVAGIKGVTTDRTEPGWYSLVARALAKGAERDPETGELAACHVWPPQLRAPRAPEGVEAATAEAAASVPAWLTEPAPTPPPAPEPLRPSRALADPDPRTDFGGAQEELSLAGRGEALIRGRALHRLLQILPNLPAETRQAAAERMLLSEVPDGDVAQEIWREAEAVMADPALAQLFGPESRAEVAIVGRVATERGEYAVSGQIDRLVRGPDGWSLLDFKTSRLVPETLEESEPAYVLQLALYRRLLMEMDPGADVAATLVWTAGPKIMPIPAAALEKALAGLGIRAKPLA
jgi:ATP-dependent helicase/nuclease subunit A